MKAKLLLDWWLPALRSTFYLALLLFITGVPVSAGSESVVGKSYFLKHSIIYFDTTPKVYEHWIVFSEANGCEVNEFSAYKGSIYIKGAQVKVTGTTDAGDWTRVTFQVKGDERQLLLRNSGHGRFKKAFNTIFSVREPRLRLGDARTKRQAIEYMGYPIYVCKEPGKERWFYILEFSGSHYSYDGWWLVFKGDNVVNVYGYI